MFSDEELLPISALQHLLFCERQCALIHVDGIWSENRLTAEGRELHTRADQPGYEIRKGVRIVRSLFLQSRILGLVGRADVVEFTHVDTSIKSEDEFDIADVIANSSTWKITPIEFKRGSPKAGRYDEVQLCAQAICLEEMCGVSITSGYLFYGEECRRTIVQINEELRQLTQKSAARLRDVMQQKVIPKAVYKKHCRSCSLFDECLPQKTDGSTSAKSFFQARLLESLTTMPKEQLHEDEL